MTMLEHQKIVLKNVIDQPELFKKEYVKSMKWLNNQEQEELNKWLGDTYYQSHKELIQEYNIGLVA